MSDDRLKIAVFIDFDNIEIGVKTTLGTYFDIGAVLEAIKERGEIVTKVAYGDWTRAGDYGRAMSQHAVHMVQRNLTPGGDKNGADINLALDALEMAFTHNHINSFVVVSGDSDFISLVEKLKQYDRKVFVLGGRAFTSVVMQKNCTEFIAYENIVGRGRPADRSRSGGDGNLSQAMPLMRRALKLLADREVVPQLGLLKSTLLQLDSAFSEREYGAGSFRDFVQKLAKAGYVTLKGSERSFHVELRESGDSAHAAGHAAAPSSPPHAEVAAPVESATTPEETAEAATVEPRGAQADGYRVIQQALARPITARWPLYVRQVKQIIRGFDPQFDERRFGFGTLIDALKYAQREGLLRVERDRQGIVRVWPGPQFQKPAGDIAILPAAPTRTAELEDLGAADAVGAEAAALASEARGGQAPLPGLTVADADADGAAQGGEAAPGEAVDATEAQGAPAAEALETDEVQPGQETHAGTTRRRSSRGRASGARKTAGARKPSSSPRAPRSRRPAKGQG